jgi:hypothetical protein
MRPNPAFNRTPRRRGFKSVRASVAAGSRLTSSRPQQHERLAQPGACRDSGAIASGFRVLLSVVLVFVQFGVPGMQLHLLPVRG